MGAPTLGRLSPLKPPRKLRVWIHDSLRSNNAVNGRKDGIELPIYSLQKINCPLFIFRTNKSGYHKI